MLKSISFKDYKIFKKKQVLKIKPITILIGKNNSGKSAVLKLPTLIDGSLGGKFDLPFELKNNDVKIGNEYRDIVQGRTNKVVELEIIQTKDSSEQEEFLSVEILVDKDKPVIYSWNYNNEFKIVKEDEKYYLDQNDKLVACTFNGINLNLVFPKDKGFESTDDVPSYNFNLNTDFIGAIRQESKTSYPYSSKIPDKYGIDGGNLYQFLINDYQTTNKKYFNLISNWIKEKFDGWELKIDVDGHQKDRPALIFLEKEKLKINISQTGMGISQVLPLIILSYKPLDQETLIIIEEPESHLHPYAHAQIAQLFFEGRELDPKKFFLLETHSLNFVLRIRRLIAEGKLNANDVAIYFVEFDDKLNESNLKEIPVDDGGGVEWWPKGVFGETTEETRAIYNAQLNDLPNVDRDK